MNTLFCGFEHDYELMDLEKILEDESCHLINLNFISKILLKSFIKLGILNKLLANFILILSKVRLSEFDQVVIKDNVLYLFLFSVLDINKKIIFRNIVTDSKFDLVKTAKCYSFDPEDCKRYSFEYYPQYTSGFYYISNHVFTSEYECSFVGVDKGRSELIAEVCECFPYDNHNILLIEKKSRLLGKLSFLRQNNLSYLNYLHFQLSGKYILDIVQGGQSGDSMRFLEAMIAQKKVITNNYNIVNHPLFSRDNVLYFNSIVDLKNKLESFEGIPFNSNVISGIDRYRPEVIIKKIIED